MAIISRNFRVTRRNGAYTDTGTVGSTTKLRATRRNGTPIDFQFGSKTVRVTRRNGAWYDLTLVSNPIVGHIHQWKGAFRCTICGKESDVCLSCGQWLCGCY